jgi:hypothetical protein
MKYVDFSTNNGAQQPADVVIDAGGEHLFNNRFGTKDLSSHSFTGQ